MNPDELADLIAVAVAATKRRNFAKGLAWGALAGMVGLGLLTVGTFALTPPQPAVEAAPAQQPALTSEGWL